MCAADLPKQNGKEGDLYEKIKGGLARVKIPGQFCFLNKILLLKASVIALHTQGFGRSFFVFLWLFLHADGQA